MWLASATGPFRRDFWLCGLASRRVCLWAYEWLNIVYSVLSFKEDNTGLRSDTDHRPKNTGCTAPTKRPSGEGFETRSAQGKSRSGDKKTLSQNWVV